ncbi:MAG: hypothetical protein U0269_37840 [Polyangiales bacterium]
MAADEWLLLIEGSKYAWGTGGVFSISSYSDEATPPAGTTIKRGYLQPIRSVISERLRPLDGNVEVSALDFVVHDTDGSGTDQFTRTLDESALTFLTTSVLTSDTSIVVANGAAITSFPTDVWVNREAMRVSARAGNTLFVTRGYYGTAAEAIEVDAAQALQPELFAYPCTLRGRRARLYRVSGTTATLRWVGYVKNGPIVAANGASFVVQCAHAWEQEAAGVWGSPQPACTLAGYDSAAVVFIVENGDKSKVVYSNPTSYQAIVHPSRNAAVYSSLGLLKLRLGSMGATNVFVLSTDTGGELLISVRFNTGGGAFTLGRAVLLYGGEEFVATSSENSGIVEHVWRVAVADRGALVRTGFALGGDDRATVIRPHVGMLDGTWAPYAGSRSGVSITPVLVGELADDGLLELDPTGQSAPGPNPNDTTFAVHPDLSGAFTFRGFSRVLSKDPNAAPEPIAWGAHRAGLPIGDALPMRSAVRIDAEHWLDGVRALLDDDGPATSGSDARNWSWSNYDATRARSGSGAVSYRTAGNTTVGEFVAEESKLRGCCVTVGADAKLSIIDLRSPTLTETPAATITVRDWVAGSTQSVAPSGDGLVTDVVFETPLRTMTLRDAVALGRYGTQNTLRVASQSTRYDPRIASDPIGYSLEALGRLLGQWRDELFIYTGTVPADRYLSSCTLGAVVSFESNNAPNFRGGSKFSGSNAKRAVVVGRREDPASNTLELELLALPTVYGFAPSARVASIAGAKITLAGGYLGASGDYAGSTLAGYQGTANDYGASWFAAGYVCELVLRDTATHTADSFTISSVNPATREITATAALPTVPTNWATAVAGGAIVDVVFTSFGSTISTQRLFAVVADESTRKVAGSGSPRKWAP